MGRQPVLAAFAWLMLALMAPTLVLLAVEEHAPAAERVAEFFQGAGDAFAGGVLWGAEGSADTSVVLALPKTEEERGAVVGG